MKPLRSAFAILLLATACDRTPSPSAVASAPASPKIIFVEPDLQAVSVLPEAQPQSIDMTRSGNEMVLEKR